MKVFVGNMTTWQKAKLLSALYDNIALSKQFAPLAYDAARELVTEKKTEIRYVADIFIGVDFTAKDGHLDLTKYNEALLREYKGKVSPGEEVIQHSLDEIGLVAIKPRGPSLLDACPPTSKTFTILSLPKTKEENTKPPIGIVEIITSVPSVGC